MATKFFNNVTNTLFDKLKGVAGCMANFDRFLAVAGFFRSSGYFKLRRELGEVKEIKILVGINVDDIFRRHNKALLWLADSDKSKAIVKDLYRKDFCEDVEGAHYSSEVESGILQMFDDLASGRLEMRIHPSKNLHAKFYLCLPNEHNANSDGWVIMGSSNISDSGFGLTASPRYELNVALKDYDDVKYCVDEFNTLWNDSIPLTEKDIDAYKNKTYLGYQPSPYELYIKVLIDAFGDQVEDDFATLLPDGFQDLKYQKDAVIQGYQMMMQHNGVLLADVVGLGKTIIASMIAKRFIEANGRRDTHILVVHPPALAENWRTTFEKFKIASNTQFITNGSLSKVLEGRDQYRDAEDFSLIIVDEAHGFRSDTSGKYDELQKICKSPCTHIGQLKSKQKKLILLSATPINNRPDDLMNLLLLFQNSRSCTIDGIPNLKAFFAPYNAAYKKLMAERSERNVTEEVEKLYDEIRSKVIDKITVRRTRTNIQNDPEYKADIMAQGIKFPSIAQPRERVYQMDAETSALFYDTLSSLTDESTEKNITYARYRAIEFLKDKSRTKYSNAEQMGQTLAGIYRVHMVKRLESSFDAFKKSLKTLHQITCDMIAMFEKNIVIIAPELNVKRLLEQDIELEQIIEIALEKGFKEEEIRFSADDFKPEFIEMLRSDRDVLSGLIRQWQNVTHDPKFELFCHDLQELYFSKKINPSGKLVIFSESVDTLNYLYSAIRDNVKRTDVLLVTAANRKLHGSTIKENFDANYPEDKGVYNILLTSDVLAEGVNLHRSNVIINYDSPWNASRLMQRIGRVNRIGSTADMVHNFLFYPSSQGDNEINLYKNALIKLQSFHSAFGEDAQIFSREEIVKHFELFDSKVTDVIDKKLALLREVRELYNKNRAYYNKIKALPLKSRAIRYSEAHTGKTVAFISSPVKTEYYLCSSKGVQAIDLLEAATYLKASPDEKAVAANISQETMHFDYVNSALRRFKQEHIEAFDVDSVQAQDLDKKSQEALNKLRRWKQNYSANEEVINLCNGLHTLIITGVYSNLPKKVIEVSNKQAPDPTKLSKLKEIAQEYKAAQPVTAYEAPIDNTEPSIIISETFI